MAAYAFAWLCGGLAAIAVVTATLIWRRRCNALRQSGAVDLLEALGRSDEWIEYAAALREFEQRLTALAGGAALLPQFTFR